jgi:hypothetical protein
METFGEFYKVLDVATNNPIIRILLLLFVWIGYRTIQMEVRKFYRRFRYMEHNFTAMNYATEKNIGDSNNYSADLAKKLAELIKQDEVIEKKVS